MQGEFNSQLFTDFPVSDKVEISIVIPIRDEAENIEKTLEAFVRQIDLSGRRFDFRRFEILVLANNCTDNSAEIIRQFKSENPFLNLYLAEISLSEENSNIGFVRRTLMNAAFARLRKKGDVLMTTDGDTIVADDWIAANLDEIGRGADAVGGRIIITDAELEKMDALCRETHLLDEEYRLLLAEIESAIDDLPFDHAPRHHQHFNGSFACTTEIYELAGGIPDVKFLEDCAFFDSLQRIDAKVRHSPNVKVYTSSRRDGRSEVGLSFQLNLWKNLNETDEVFLVESAESIVERFSTKRNLRVIWRKFAESENFDWNEIESVAERKFVPAKIIFRELEKRQTFGAFYENILHEQNRTGEWTRCFPFVALETALTNLKNLKNLPTKDTNQTKKRQTA
jgi:glycosyltransferase involved in cell wall biosynthesis